MIIALSGTPGTGKTVISKVLAKKLNANLISIGELVKKKKIPYKIDAKRRTKIIDVGNLQKAVNENLTKEGINIVEGHLSHLIRANRVIILRLNPIKLKNRLLNRGWSRSKVEESVQAEILDEITIEALQRQSKNNVFEIDVTGLEKGKITGILTKLCRPKILNRYLKIYQAGKVDWSERYKKELIK